jgi:raffinose/stachyose/melibiose transport system permease protein
MPHKKGKQNFVLIMYTLPALIVYIVFKLSPAISGIFYSMTNWNGINRTYNFIGFANFIEIFSDAYFWQSLGFTVKYVAVLLITANTTALVLAAAIESRGKNRGIYRTLFYLPNMMSMIIGGYMWRFIFTRVLYYMADNWGWKLLDHSWVGDTRFAFLSIIIVASWGSTGFLMIIYMAALQGIPREVKEAAWIDGAGSWQSFWAITFPMLRASLTICIFWTLSSAFQVFDVIFSLTGGGPGRATQSVAINVYEEAFKGNIRYGYATAKSTILFIVVFIITAIQLRFMKKREIEL